MLLECVEQRGGKAKVTLHELVIILWTVDTGKVKDKIGLRTVVIKFFWCRVDIVLEDLVYLEGIVVSFPVLDVIKLSAKIAATKPLAPVTNIFIIRYGFRVWYRVQSCRGQPE